jgi:hypothetical protein
MTTARRTRPAWTCPHKKLSLLRSGALEEDQGVPHLPRVLAELLPRLTLPNKQAGVTPNTLSEHLVEARAPRYRSRILLPQLGRPSSSLEGAP